MMLTTANPTAVPVVQSDTANSRLLDVQAVASLLDCSPRHVCRLVESLLMPSPVRLGALVRWRRLELESWISEGCPAVPPVGNRGRGGS